MKKLLKYLVLAALVFTGTPSHALGDETGDTISNSSSNVFDFSATSETSLSFSADIDDEKDFDVFKIILPSNLRVFISTGDGTDTTGELLDSEGNSLLFSDDRFDEASGFNLSKELVAGTYFIKVGGFGSSTGNFELSVRITPDSEGASVDDPSSQVISFQTIEDPELTISGSLNFFNDTDVFKVLVPETSVLIVNNDNNNFQIKILDKNGIPLSTELTDTTDLQATVGAGEVFISVSRKFSSGLTFPLDYSFRVKLEAAIDDTNGNSLQDLSPTVLNHGTKKTFKVKGELTRGDSDVFSLLIPNIPRIIIAKTKGEAEDTSIEILDSEGNLIADDELNGSFFNSLGIRAKLKTRLLPGNYFLRVRSSSPELTDSNKVSYTLNTIVFKTRKESVLDGVSVDQTAKKEINFRNTSKTTKKKIRPAFDGPNDIDFFKINIPADGNLMLESFGRFDTVGRLFGPEGKVIAEGDDLGDPDAHPGLGMLNFNFNADVVPGSYILEVSRLFDFGTPVSGEGPYTLKFTYEPN